MTPSKAVVLVNDTVTGTPHTTGLLYLTLSLGVFGLWPLPGAVAVLTA